MGEGRELRHIPAEVHVGQEPLLEGRVLRRRRHPGCLVQGQGGPVQIGLLGDHRKVDALHAAQRSLERVAGVEDGVRPPAELFRALLQPPEGRPPLVRQREQLDLRLGQRAARALQQQGRCAVRRERVGEIPTRTPPADRADLVQHEAVRPVHQLPRPGHRRHPLGERAAGPLQRRPPV
ncbi:MAG: hypothetical protein ACK559_33285, partial [bacterium]